MSRIRKLSFFGILAVAIAVLFLAGISFVQAQSKTPKGKPDKPGKPGKNGEKVTWAVQIPEASWNLKGMHNADESPYVYANNNDDIIVSVERKGWRAAGESGIYYILLFKLVNPTIRYVEFSGVSLSEEATEYPEYGAPCVLAGDCGLGVPDCMECFLNQQQHPYSSNSVDYDHVYIKFWIWRYDIENMPIYAPYKLGTNSNSDRIRIKTGYTPVNTCFREEPAYHDIICQKYADGLLNIWIEKIDDNKWQIYGDVSDLPVQESYCIEKKDKGWVSTTVTTLEATGNFSFVMDWIKNPQ